MSYLTALGERAKVAAVSANALLTEDLINDTLRKVAARLLVPEYTARILAANQQDIEYGRANGMKESLIDRLSLNTARIEGMAEGLNQVAKLTSPIGEIVLDYERPNGMRIMQQRVPFGVIGMIYEARPNVTIDAFGLCFKTRNVVILKGGSDALHSNMAIVAVIREVLEEQGINPDMVLLIEKTDRETTTELMRLNRYVDLLIPRGGAGLIRSVVENSTVPVIETGTGNCHVYVDKDADLSMAVKIIINAKTQRVSVCNACESLLIHEAVMEALLPELSKQLHEHNVVMRCDDRIGAINEYAEPADEADWGKEYLDYMISMKTVSGVDEAIAHINRYNTGHSETIVTENEETAKRFLELVDAACVYHNVSTRFTDGFEFGLGAEIGISTQKLHARGPMGLLALTTTKYKITGNGQIRG